MKILVIDNYDSFTYNLVQLLGQFCNKLVIKRNDEISIKDIKEINPNKILISPGPGKPEDSNISLTTIKELGNIIPILGVCLGHQAIGIAYGAKVVKAKELKHGKTSLIKHDGKTIFTDIPQNFVATRYHSLVIDPDSLPSELVITAETDDHVIMGVRHNSYDIEGIQFHPESILTKQGYNLIKNWVLK
ncbi:MAG TPA: aminodeoxychorismate/anthranilate synthase component II [Melioribacteraceae bacterium]|nr:aminodeoxychorismate/anthranilate synthase component II [Melioribacteraceae bacterium]